MRTRTTSEPGVVGESSSESSPYSSANDFWRRNLLFRAPAVGVEPCNARITRGSNSHTCRWV